MLCVLRRGVGQDSEAGDGVEELGRGSRFSELANRATDAVFVALQQRLVEVYFLPFFLIGFFAAVPVVVVVAAAIPSDSERLSSTRTVWVMASVPVGAGFASAGAIVCVDCCEEPAGPLRCRAHPQSETAARVRRRMVFFTPNL